MTPSHIGPSGRQKNISHHDDLYDDNLRSAFETETGLTTAVPRIMAGCIAGIASE